MKLSERFWKSVCDWVYLQLDAVISRDRTLPAAGAVAVDPALMAGLRRSLGCSNDTV
jgi:hypothetical protein